MDGTNAMFGGKESQSSSSSQRQEKLWGTTSTRSRRDHSREKHDHNDPRPPPRKLANLLDKAEHYKRTHSHTHPHTRDKRTVVDERNRDRDRERELEVGGDKENVENQSDDDHHHLNLSSSTLYGLNYASSEPSPGSGFGSRSDDANDKNDDDHDDHEEQKMNMNSDVDQFQDIVRDLRLDERKRKGHHHHHHHGGNGHEHEHGRRRRGHENITSPSSSVQVSVPSLHRANSFGGYSHSSSLSLATTRIHNRENNNHQNDDCNSNNNNEEEGRINGNKADVRESYRIESSDVDGNGDCNGNGNADVDGYVRSGAHFRDLLDHAFQKVALIRKNGPNVRSRTRSHPHSRAGGTRSSRGRKRKVQFGRGVGRRKGGDDEKDLGMESTEGEGTMEEEQSHHQSRRSRSIGTTCTGRRRKMNPQADEDNNRNGKSKHGEDPGDDSDYGSDDESSSDGMDHESASVLAREKVTEVLNLKRSLGEAEEEVKALTNANSSLRESSSASSKRLETISQALRIAGEKAAKARADADAADARSKSLMTQLKSFQGALEETKRTYEAIRMEHDDISSAARDLEKRLVQTEVELEKVRDEKIQAEMEASNLRDQVEALKHGEKVLRSLLEKKENLLVKLNKKMVERGDIEKARLERTNRLETELRESRSMLVEVTSTAAEAESITTELRSTIVSLQRENTSLHEKNAATIQDAARERAKLQKALTEAENEAQKLRLKAAADDEELQKFKLDKMSSEKEVLQLQNRIANIEKRSSGNTDVNDLCMDMPVSAGVTSPSDAGFSTISDISSIHSSSTFDSSGKTCSKSTLFGDGNVISTDSGAATLSKFLKESHNKKTPLKSNSFKDSSRSMSLTPHEKDPHLLGTHVDLPSNKIRHNRTMRMSIGGNARKNSCSICFKAAYGIMKSCQCGNPSCDLRAHATCIASKKSLSSVSHPGTPAPILPVVLCRREI